MARPKDDDKRNAILAAATRVIVARGLGAPTATIAQEAGVANGTLFTYFETKADLLNRLYLELKAGMASAVLEGLPLGTDHRERFSCLWTNWTAWAVANPEKRRVLALLTVADEITQASRDAGHEAMAGIGELLEQARAGGPLRDAPMGLVVAILGSLAEATIDYMIRDPAHAKEHRDAGFGAMWRVLS